MECGGKKTAAAIYQEVAREVEGLLRRVFAERRQTGRVDWEAVEKATRTTLHRAGAAALSQLLSGPEVEPRPVDCPCGQKAQYHDRRNKRLLTVVGPVQIERAYYVCRCCGQGQAPRDRGLDVEGTECSPGVRRMMAVVGSETSFEQGREQLEALAGLQVTAKAVERQAEAIGSNIGVQEQAEIHQAMQGDRPPACRGPEIPVLYIEMDGTGVPVVAAETKGRPGKMAGQPARTREAKLGCVFTQTGVDRDGRPVRDPESTTYTGAIETAEEFGQRLYAEVWNRGGSRAKKKVVIGDGAPWIWNLAGEHFPGAIEIVDLSHARQHLWELSAKLFPQERARKRWAGKLQRMLDRGKIAGVVQALRPFPPPRPELADLLDKEADYFAHNAQRMRYPNFRAQGLFVGSGVVEAGCKSVIAARLKRSGMFWTVRGANAILALRCCRLSKEFEDYWESRPRAA